jgi:predicted kinase
MKLILIRGLPGAGKSDMSRLFDGPTFAADDFFYGRGDGQYDFDPRLLPQAHQSCQERTRKALSSGGSSVVVVTNTFSQRWELEPYLRMADELGARCSVVDLFDGGLTNSELAARGLHGVPVEGIQVMRSRWEHDWRNGDPVAPWHKVA